MSKSEHSGGEFLHKREKKLHTSQPVEHEQTRQKRSGEKISQNPASKLENWMKILERTHIGNRNRPKAVKKIKNYYYKKHVIKAENIPESYFDTQVRLHREQGRGNLEINDEQRKNLIETIIANQKSTLDLWLNYFISEDSDSYPMWAKYWAFNGMLKLSTFDKEKHEFGKRNKRTNAPFADLNHEALAYVIDAVIKQVKGENINLNEESEDFQKLLKGANFGKLYTWAIEKATSATESELNNVQGEWVKFNQGDDHMPLIRSLQGYGTGWCTAGESTAKFQLKNGDLHIFYSNDETGNPSTPRVAILMNGHHEIVEIRGVAPEQDLDPYIGGTVSEKLGEFGNEAENFRKKISDMNYLKQIDDRITKKETQPGTELSVKNLVFLYELESPIQGFAEIKDTRIAELLKNRDVKNDIAKIITFLGQPCTRKQVSTSQDEALSGDIIYHYGDLELNDSTKVEGLVLPKAMKGDLDFRSLPTVEGLVLPEIKNGNFLLNNIKTEKGLVLPETINGYLNLSNLTTAEKLVFPKTINGYLNLSNLTTAERLVLPETINGYLSLHSLTTTENLIFPKTINGSLLLNSIKIGKGLVLPETIKGYLGLSNLITAEGLMLPRTVKGDLDLQNLTTTEGLVLPETVKGNIYLNRLSQRDKQKLREKRPDLNIV